MDMNIFDCTFTFIFVILPKQSQRDLQVVLKHYNKPMVRSARVIVTVRSTEVGVIITLRAEEVFMCAVVNQV